MFLSMAILIALGATSCNEENNITFTEFKKSADTTIVLVHFKPTLQNRTGCNDTIIPTKFVDGKPVGQKVKGWEMVKESIPVSVSVKVTADDMKNHMVVGKKPASDNSSSSNGGFWNGFCGILPYLLGLLGFGLILWLLSLLPWFGGRERQIVINNNIPNPPTPPAPPIVKPETEKTTDSDQKSEKVILKYVSGIPMDMLLSGVKQSGNGIQVIANNSGDGNITINVNGKEPVTPVPPVTPAP